MTRLRELMIEELRRRNFAESTIRAYVRGVEHFSQYFHRRPDQLGPEHIRRVAPKVSLQKQYAETTLQRNVALRLGLRIGTNHLGFLSGFWKLNDAESVNFHCVPNQVLYPAEKSLHCRFRTPLTVLTVHLIP